MEAIDLLDLESKPREVEEVRWAVKAHLNCDSFFDSFLGREYKYRVPDFFPGQAGSEDDDEVKPV